MHQGGPPKEGRPRVAGFVLIEREEREKYAGKERWRDPQRDRDGETDREGRWRPQEDHKPSPARASHPERGDLPQEGPPPQARGSGQELEAGIGAPAGPPAVLCPRDPPSKSGASGAAASPVYGWWLPGCPPCQGKVPTVVLVRRCHWAPVYGNRIYICMLMTIFVLKRRLRWGTVQVGGARQGPGWGPAVSMGAPAAGSARAGGGGGCSRLSSEA